MTVTNKPDHRGEREISHRAGNAGLPGEPVVTNSCAFYFAHEAAGATGTRRFLHPLLLREADAKLGRIAIVTDAGWDAMDAGGASDEGVVLRTAKPCGPDTPTLVSSS